MAITELKARISHRYKTSAEWDEVIDFIPRVGEIIVYSDLNKMKIGNGIDLPKDLEFLNGDLQSQIYFTPEQFGAKGDGIADDTEAFQAALDASTASLNIPPDVEWADYRWFGIPVIANKNYKITHPIHTANSLIINGCIHYYDYEDIPTLYNLSAKPKNTLNENNDNVALSIYSNVYNEVGDLHHQYFVVCGKQFKINIVNEMPYKGNKDIIDPVTGEKGRYEYTDDKTIGVQFINCRECDIELSCINKFYIAELFECRGMSEGTGNIIRNGNILNFKYGLLQLLSNGRYGDIDYIYLNDKNNWWKTDKERKNKMREGSFDENLFVNGLFIGVSNESSTKYKRKYATGIYVCSKYNTSNIVLNYSENDTYEIDISKREKNDNNCFAQKYDNILSVNSVFKIDKNGNKIYCKSDEYTVNKHGANNYANTETNIKFKKHLSPEEVEKVIINYTSEYSHQISGNIYYKLAPGYMHNSFTLEKCRLNYFYNTRIESVDNGFVLNRYCQDNYIHVSFNGAEIIKDNTSTGNVILAPKDFLSNTYTNTVIDTKELINKCVMNGNVISIPNVHEINEPKANGQFIKGPKKVSNNCHGFVLSENGIKTNSCNGAYLGAEITTKQDKKILTGFNGSPTNDYYKYISYEDIPEALFKYTYFNYYTVDFTNKEQKFKRNSEYKKNGKYYEMLEKRPEDWDTNNIDYTTFSSSTRITPSFIPDKVFDSNYNKVTTEPTNWDSTYTNYYYQNFVKTTDETRETGKTYYIPLYEKILDANDTIPFSFKNGEWFKDFYYKIDDNNYQLISQPDMNKDIYAIYDYKEDSETPLSNCYELKGYSKISSKTKGFGNKHSNNNKYTKVQVYEDYAPRMFYIKNENDYILLESETPPSDWEKKKFPTDTYYKDKIIYEYINSGWKLFVICKDKDGNMIGNKYKLLETKPSDWEYNFNNYYYYIKDGKNSKYEKINSQVEFEPNTYYKLFQTIPLIDVNGVGFEILRDNIDYIRKLFDNKIDSDLSKNYLYILKSFLSNNEIVIDVPDNVESVYIGLVTTDKDLELNRFYLKTASNEIPYRISSSEAELDIIPTTDGLYNGQIVKNSNPNDSNQGWIWYNNKWNTINIVSNNEGE